MLRRVLLLALFHLYGAADIGVVARGKQATVRQPIRRRDPPLPLQQPVDSGAAYYQRGYDGYPSQAVQPVQDGYREAQAAPQFPAATTAIQSAAQPIRAESTGFIQSAQPITLEPAVSASPAASAAAAAEASAAERVFFTSGTTASGVTAVSATSTVRQASSSAQLASSQPSAPGFPQTSQSANPSFTQSGIQPPTITQPSKTSSASPAAQQQQQPVVFPSQSSTSSQLTSSSSSQPVFANQPASSTVSQPIFASQTLPSQPQLSQPQSQPQPQPQPVTAQPSAQPTPIPATIPGIYLPGPPAKDFDMRGCYTDTTFCPTTNNCVATIFFNISCPNYREPVYMNSFNLECSAEAQAAWARLNYTAPVPQPPYLSTWTDGTMRSILLDFISRVTNPSLDTYVPREMRVANFDNDGTVWIEQPVLNQVAFLLWFVKRFPDPGQILQTQLSGYLDGSTRGDPMSAVLSGLSVDMYNDFIRLWAEETRHPTWLRPYPELVFTPMIELINLMQAACFNVFIVSGGENIFMRALLPQLYGVAPSNLVGSFMDLKYEQSATPGAGMEFKIYPRTPVVVDRALKPVAVQRSVGRQPIFAFGNSDGDFEMLQYATTLLTGSGLRLGVLLKHDDAAREIVYDGHLTRTIPEAPGRGWLFASMKNDFKQVFPTPAAPILYTSRPRVVPTPAPTPQPTIPKALPYVPRTLATALPPLSPLTSSQPAFTSLSAVSLPPTLQPFSSPPTLQPFSSSTAIPLQPLTPTTAPTTAQPTVRLTSNSTTNPSNQSRQAPTSAPTTKPPTPIR